MWDVILPLFIGLPALIGLALANAATSRSVLGYFAHLVLFSGAVACHTEGFMRAWALIRMVIFTAAIPATVWLLSCTKKKSK
jgi:hypothetical protein